MNSLPTITNVAGTTYVDDADLGITLAQFHPQGADHRLRCFFSPDDYVDSRHPSRDSARAAAIRHAARF